MRAGRFGEQRRSGDSWQRSGRAHRQRRSWRKVQEEFRTVRLSERASPGTLTSPCGSWSSRLRSEERRVRHEASSALDRLTDCRVVEPGFGRVGRPKKKESE